MTGSCIGGLLEARAQGTVFGAKGAGSITRHGFRRTDLAQHGEIGYRWIEEGLRRELIDRPIVIGAAVYGRAVEVPRRITDHSVVGIGCVRRAGECVLDPLRPRPGSMSQLEDRADPRGAALARRAVQV